MVEILDQRTLPPRWRTDEQLSKLQEIGAIWLQQQRSVALAVPSAVITEQSNYVLNPAHPDFKHVVADKPRPFWLDPRLVK